MSVEIEFICMEFKDVTFPISRIYIFVLVILTFYKFCREKQHVVYRDIGTGLYPR